MSKNVYEELIRDEKAFTRISGLKQALFEDLYGIPSSKYIFFIR